MAQRAPESSLYRDFAELFYHNSLASGVRFVYQVGAGGPCFTYYDPASLGDHTAVLQFRADGIGFRTTSLAHLGGPLHHLVLGDPLPADITQAISAIVEAPGFTNPFASSSSNPNIPVLTPNTSSSPSEMGSQEDDGIPRVRFPLKPEGWKGDPGNLNFRALGTLSPPVMRRIEPAGPHFLAFARRKRHGRTFSEDERIQAQNRVKKIEDDESTEISEPEDPLMLSRDAKDWKGQDHYAVLGLSKYRWKATPEQIKNAHRKKVLRHHPDKKAAKGQSDDDSFFKCIQRANEILEDPVKRRQFDSVDEAADVDPPGKKEVQKRGFYKMWNPVFESEARFSNKQPVPMLGDENSTKEEVDEFYNFWYNFDSWRTFEYLDEDVPDDNEGRDHKRHIEKKNANARRKKKTEDTARLRQVVDQALEQDERIKKFRQESKANKNKKKNEREAAAKREAEEKQKAKEEADRQQKEAEEAAKTERAESKKAKEAAKNAVKKNKRVLKASVKDVNYFASGGDASAAQVDGVLTDVELIMGMIDPDELAALAGKLNLAGKDAEKVKGAYEDEVKRLVDGGKIKEEDLKVIKS